MPELEERVLYLSQRYSWPKALQIKPGRQTGPSGWWQGSQLCWGMRSGPLFLKAPQTALLKHEGAFIPGKVMPLAVHASIMLFIFSYLHYWNPVSLQLSYILPFPSPLTYPRPHLTLSSILFSISKLSPPTHPRLSSPAFWKQVWPLHLSHSCASALLQSHAWPCFIFGLFHPQMPLSHPLSSKLLNLLCLITLSHNAWKASSFSTSLSSFSVPPVLGFPSLVSRVPPVCTTSS